MSGRVGVFRRPSSSGSAGIEDDAGWVAQSLDSLARSRVSSRVQLTCNRDSLIEATFEPHTRRRVSHQPGLAIQSKMKPKRRRAPTSPLELANSKTDEDFIADYLQHGSVSLIIHTL